MENGEGSSCPRRERHHLSGCGIRGLEQLPAQPGIQGTGRWCDWHTEGPWRWGKSGQGEAEPIFPIPPGEGLFGRSGLS